MLGLELGLTPLPGVAAPCLPEAGHGASEIVGVVPSVAVFVGVLWELSALACEPGQISALAMRGQPDRRLDNTCAGISAQCDGRFSGIEAIKRGASPCLVKISDCEAIVASGGSLAFALAAVLLADLPDPGLHDLLAHTVDPRHRQAIAELVTAGGVLLWIRSSSNAWRGATLDALRRHGARCVHQVARRA